MACEEPAKEIPPRFTGAVLKLRSQATWAPGRPRSLTEVNKRDASVQLRYAATGKRKTSRARCCRDEKAEDDGVAVA